MNNLIKNIIPFIYKSNTNLYVNKYNMYSNINKLILSDLISYYLVYIYLNKKKDINSNDYSLKEFNNNFDSIFNNINILNENTITNLYDLINEKKCYIRNVRIMLGIIYKSEWIYFYTIHINMFDKCNNVKNKVRYFNKIIKTTQLYLDTNVKEI